MAVHPATRCWTTSTSLGSWTDVFEGKSVEPDPDRLPYVRGLSTYATGDWSNWALCSDFDERGMKSHMTKT